VYHRAGDVRLHYEMHGQLDNPASPWIVFSHSLACNTTMWAQQVSHFSTDYRLLLFDTLGHGGSDAPADGYSFDTLSDHVDSLLTAHAIEEPHFVGLSLGGMIGQAFALRHPGRLRSLTIANSTSRWPAETAAIFADRVALARREGMEAISESTLQRWFTAKFRDVNPDVIAPIRASIRTTPIEGYAGCSNIIPHVNFTERLRDIQCPILIIAGQEDPGTPVAMSEAMHRAAPHSRMVVLKDAAHLSNLEQPTAFNSALAEFIRDCDDRAFASQSRQSPRREISVA
jgi:3-oxoadipate enol-lactonase